jgi:excisionase family DNA binding protein
LKENEIRSRGVASARDLICPRGLSRLEAARYIGVSENTYDKLVAEGRMPPAIRIGTRRVYDRERIDLFFSAFGDEPAYVNAFDRSE